MNIKKLLINEEKILFSKGANHILKFEAVGGKLFITKKRVIFKSHNFNIQNHELIIDYSNIDKIIFTNIMGFIPNGLIIKTKDNKKEKFVVWKRQTIKDLIENELKLLYKNNI